MSGFTIGQRVKLHPATDLFMRGCCYGTVKKIGRKYLHVNVDRLGKVVRITADNLLPAD